MEFGKLPDISSVDFRLRAEPPENRRILGGSGLCNFYIGCTGWSMKEWVGKVYPIGAKTKDYLHHYSRQFNTIEFNTTHYRIPDFGTVERWYAESAADFRFCPKIPQTISHSQDLGASSGQVFEFAEAIGGLKEKIGCCFMQLPEHFGPERWRLLDEFLERFPPNVPLAVEVRHPGWFKPEGESILFPLLEGHGKAAVITDVAGRRDVAHMRLSAPLTMVRFVGNGLHPSDFTRIDEWVERLKTWAEQGIREIIFFAHEPDNLLAPELSVYLLEKVQARIAAHVRGPQLLSAPEIPGKQLGLFE